MLAAASVVGGIGPTEGLIEHLLLARDRNIRQPPEVQNPTCDVGKRGGVIADDVRKKVDLRPEKLSTSMPLLASFRITHLTLS